MWSFMGQRRYFLLRVAAAKPPSVNVLAKFVG
jgi:hypothetical protein